MKYFLLAIMLSTLTNLTAQCQYSSVEINRATQEVYLKTLPITLDEYETPFNGRIVLASLIRNGDTYFIEIEITTDSSSQDLEPICFNQGARISFSLKNNKILSLTQRAEKVCGIKNYNEETGYTSVSNYAVFIITQQAFETLIDSEVIMMKITDKNYDKTFVLKDELEQIIENEVIMTDPGRFFMDHIKCLTQPQFK